MNFDNWYRGAFCQVSSRWIYYYGSNESTGKETGKTHLCERGGVKKCQRWFSISLFRVKIIRIFLIIFFIEIHQLRSKFFDNIKLTLFSKMMPNFRQVATTTIQKKIKNFLKVSWFSGKNLINFVTLAGKLDNPYYHNFLCSSLGHFQRSQ